MRNIVAKDTISPMNQSEQSRDSRSAILWHYLDMVQYPLMLVIKWTGVWMLAALLLDVPGPGLLNDFYNYPEIAAGLVGLMMFLVAGDAARYHKQRVWNNGE
jgi:hypothetical protein